MTRPPRILTACAPARLDFGGGWTDVPPYSHEEGGCVCNVAIALYARVRIQPRTTSEQQDIRVVRASDAALALAALRRFALADVEVSLESDFPAGAGLGGSSAAGVAVLGALHAWNGGVLDPAILAEESRRLEVEDLGVAGGRQDHYAAALGGALALYFGESTEARRIALSPSTRAALEQRCVVAYTGQSRISGDTITAVLDAYRAREGRVLTALHQMKTLAEQMVEALTRENIDDLARLVGEHWRFQRSLHPAIPTPLIDELLDRAAGAGALGGKALGASGGGCVLAIAAPGREDDVRRAMGELAQLLPVTIDEAGFTVRVEP